MTYFLHMLMVSLLCLVWYCFIFGWCLYFFAYSCNLFASLFAGFLKVPHWLCAQHTNYGCAD